MNWIEEINERLAQHKRNELAESRRLYHGRGGLEDGPKHVAVEWHPNILTFIFYREHEDEVRWLEDIKRVFADADVSVRVQRRYQNELLNEVLIGSTDDVYGRCDGFSFELDLRARQNPGYFMDMREVHRWVRDNSKNKQVLNLFSYTCIFSVYAAAGGAQSVVNMDMSKGAIKTGKINHKRNNLSEGVRFFAHDVFASWSKIRKYGPYDLLIIDPPSFQKGSFVASKDYARVLRQIPRFASDGAQILLCINSPEISRSDFLEVIAQDLPEANFVEWLSQADDFAEAPGASALKVALYTIRH